MATIIDSISWEVLLQKLRQIFEKDCVDVEDVKQLLALYTSDPNDWQTYTKFDPHRYTRNLVDEGSGKYNVIVLCWGEGQGSPIHDHAGSHCFMKMLKGSLQETLYSWPEDGKAGQMKETVSNTFSVNSVAYIKDTIGLHRVENMSHTDTAISLHIYCPPIKCCKSFDELTGKYNCCKVTFHSTSTKC